MWYRIYAPAKINRFLLVGPPDARGYHPLVTLFQCIDWCDILTLQCRSLDGPFTWRGRGDAPDLADLRPTTVGRALAALARVRHLRGTWAVYLSKRIPPGSGLGGGSSDAAAVLVGMAGLMGLGLAFGTLVQLARAVGMDVAYFLTGGTVLASGYGDRLVPLPDETGSGSAVVVIVPPARQATAEMYRELDRQGLHEPDLPDPMDLLQDRARLRELMDTAPNSFAPLLQQRFPELQDVPDRLRQWGARTVQWTGSGSGLWSLWPDLSEAWRITRELRAWLPPTYRIRPARILTRAEFLHLRRCRPIAPPTSHPEGVAPP